jgi:O-antigen ligase
LALQDSEAQNSDAESLPDSGLAEVKYLVRIGLPAEGDWLQSDSGPDVPVEKADSPASSGGPKAPRKINAGAEKRRRVVLYFALTLIFIRFSVIHQIIAQELHMDLYLLYVVGIPVLIGIPITGGLKRAFLYRPTRYWTYFALWLIPASVFSTWKGGSLTGVATYYRTELIILFAIAGLVTTWRECRWVFYTIAAATLVNIWSLIAFGQKDDAGRTHLDFGSIANSNDYAGHMIFCTPFLLWFVLTTKSFWLRIPGFAILALAVYQILSSASRGALLGLTAAIIIFVFASSPKTRKMVMLTAPVIVVVALLLLPSSALHRIFSFSDNSPTSSREALESSDIRKQLLKDSIIFTFQHPVFGVGPFQFSANEGKKVMPGLGFALYLQPHNSFTQVSSENGIPGLILFIAAIFSCFSLLRSVDAFSRKNRGLNEITTAVLCLRISLIAFCVTISFLNFAYTFYLPAMAGITAAVAGSSANLARQKVG